ncbi:hypothetical protein [Capnocytophaga periodontitidis]|uniref:hypothetical protein n=1 Tax=Capnocytophaga periodontitidis TaxID=2795027 RepID=UPI0018E1B8EA|nr:hypothetical protein [Capnocytophaga periodontitidis]MBI1668109.1 hypothetical protein [Capnocytophaga periodontitidis]
MKHLLITGAGVDRSKGIDFPLANTLLGGITGFLTTEEGKRIDEVLREMLPNMRFSFNSMIKTAVDKIVTREPNEQKKMIERVQKAIKGLSEDDKIHKHGMLIIKLFNKLVAIAENSNLDEDIENLIREVFPNKADVLIDSDSILDIHKLSLSDTFKEVLKITLRLGLEGKSHAVAEALGAEMLNIELLLIEKFLGFYNNKSADIKSYIYISWVLWAYLVFKQKEVLEALSKKRNAKMPFYGNLPTSLRAITLNYTSFLENQLGKENVIYFHGGLAEYVRMDTRELLEIENLNKLNLEDFLSSIIKPSIDVTNNNIEEQIHIIPSLVPPLRLKPILSYKYIELWAKASEWVQEAEHIVIVGYSFNSADEHFNDILRNLHPNKKIDIIDPGATTDHFKGRIEKIFGTPANQFVKNLVQGKTALKKGSIRLIEAIATDIDIDKLLNS